MSQKRSPQGIGCEDKIREHSLLESKEVNSRLNGKACLLVVFVQRQEKKGGDSGEMSGASLKFRLLGFGDSTKIAYKNLL